MIAFRRYYINIYNEKRHAVNKNTNTFITNNGSILYYCDELLGPYIVTYV